MMYFDNGATTYPKPPTVLRAMTLAMRDCGANPGRSGHRMSLRAAEIIYRCRESVAQLFDFDKPEQVVFTCNCTAALNTVIKGVLHSAASLSAGSLTPNTFEAWVQMTSLVFLRNCERKARIVASSSPSVTSATE